LAMGMTGSVAFRRIVFPQIWRASLPALVSEMTLLIKASPAVAIIGVVDLTRKARQIAATTYEPLPPFVAAAVVYGLALALLVARVRPQARSLVGRPDYLCALQHCRHGANPAGRVGASAAGPDRSGPGLWIHGHQTVSPDHPSASPDRRGTRGRKSVDPADQGL